MLVTLECVAPTDNHPCRNTRTDPRLPSLEDPSHQNHADFDRAGKIGNPENETAPVQRRLRSQL